VIRYIAAEMMKKVCNIEGCGRAHLAKGLCDKHYRRFMRGGDPHTPSPKELTLEERFLAKLGPKDPVTGCIEWTGSRKQVGSRKQAGYGRISRDGKLVQTHRLAYELKHGPIPDGMEVCHSCDNPPCCNEEHLRLDTHAGNVADMMTKGRGVQPKGEDHGNAKLTEANVLDIRRLIEAGEDSASIAQRFKVSRSCIILIAQGKNWAHIK
jgi:hypothetical protein